MGSLATRAERAAKRLRNERLGRAWPSLVLIAGLSVAVAVSSRAQTPADSGAARVAAAGSETSGAGGADKDTAGFGTYVSEAQRKRFAKVPWKVGEYFQFSIEWNGLNGGSSLMQIQNLHTVAGRKAYRIVTKAESNSFVSKFYKVRDRAESFVDAESLYTLRFVKHLREGGYKQDIDVRFDQPRGKAVYSDGPTLDVPAHVHDVLSAFYYVRTRALPIGSTFVIPTHDNKKSYEMEVKVHRKERIEVPAGKFDCILVEPVLKSEGVFKSKGSIHVWLTDDERRIPVLVRSKVPIGSISVSLTDMRLAFERRP
jgi:hypothetical protein